MKNEKFAGCWKLVEFEYHRPDGEVVFPLGKNPIGSLIYHSNGRYSMQISRHDRPVFTKEYFQNRAPDEFKLAVDGYFAYFGRYKVNEADGIIIHTVEGSLFPNWIGTEQIRRFQFEGDRLIYDMPLRQQGADRRTGHLVWERVK